MSLRQSTDADHGTGGIALKRLLALTGMTLALGGCTLDNFIDPSVVGRWEDTPTSAPILERIASIEDEGDEFVEFSDVRSEDLVPETVQYRVSSGDGIRIIVLGAITQGRSEVYDRVVDSRGFIDLPQVGEIFVGSLTVGEIRQEVEQAFDIIQANTLAEVVLTSQRQQSYYVFGAIRSPGPYFVPEPDYRLLEAITTAGGVSEVTPYIYVIRHVPLSDEVSATPMRDSGPSTQPPPLQPGEDLLDIIDDLSGDEGSPASIGAFGARGSTSGARRIQPAGDAPPPVIDLVDDFRAPAAGQTDAVGDATGWMFVNGEWVQAQPAQSTGVPAGDALEDLVTQRVIRVPVRPLLNGDARYNIVVRPGDLIRVPEQGVGNVYVGGEIVRPGVYGIAPQLTLSRLIDAAGGLSAVAIPERVDLTRMTGMDRQSTIQLNLRAIREGSQPDIYIKANDHINVGTSFWATPLAVVRSGFRFTYGFGFLVDRNFGNDIFGPPPNNNRF